MKRLFRTIDELTGYLAIDPNIELEKLYPFIDKAQLFFIKPLLGNLYDTLITDYDTNNGDTFGVSRNALEAECVVIPTVPVQGLGLLGLLMAGLGVFGLRRRRKSER